MREPKAGSILLAWSGASAGPQAALGRRVLPRTEPDSLGMSLPREILHPAQLLAGNLWLDLSVSAEPEPKSLWFPGVTTALHSQKAEWSVLALSAHSTSGLH